MQAFNVIATTTEDTVVAQYEPAKKRSDRYQSEAALEKEFIQMLTQQGYEYLPIHKEADLIANLRRQLELLNDYVSPTASGSSSSLTPSPTPMSTSWKRPARSRRTMFRCCIVITALLKTYHS